MDINTDAERSALHSFIDRLHEHVSSHEWLNTHARHNSNINNTYDSSSNDNNTNNNSSSNETSRVSESIRLTSPTRPSGGITVGVQQNTAEWNNDGSDYSSDNSVINDGPRNGYNRRGSTSSNTSNSHVNDMTSLNLSSANAFVNAALDGVRGMVGRRHLPHSLANEAATLTATQLLSSSTSSSPQPQTTTATAATARTSSTNARITPTPLQSNTPQASQSMLSSQMPHSQNTITSTTTANTIQQEGSGGGGNTLLRRPGLARFNGLSALSALTETSHSKKTSTFPQVYPFFDVYVRDGAERVLCNTNVCSLTPERMELREVRDLVSYSPLELLNRAWHLVSVETKSNAFAPFSILPECPEISSVKLIEPNAVSQFMCSTSLQLAQRQGSINTTLLRSVLMTSVVDMECRVQGNNTHDASASSSLFILSSSCSPSAAAPCQVAPSSSQDYQKQQQQEEQQQHVRGQDQINRSSNVMEVANNVDNIAEALEPYWETLYYSEEDVDDNDEEDEDETLSDKDEQNADNTTECDKVEQHSHDNSTFATATKDNQSNRAVSVKESSSQRERQGRNVCRHPHLLEITYSRDNDRQQRMRRQPSRRFVEEMCDCFLASDRVDFTDANMMMMMLINNYNRDTFDETSMLQSSRTLRLLHNILNNCIASRQTGVLRSWSMSKMTRNLLREMERKVLELEKETVKTNDFDEIDTKEVEKAKEEELKEMKDKKRSWHNHAQQEAVVRWLGVAVPLTVKLILVLGNVNYMLSLLHWWYIHHKTIATITASGVKIMVDTINSFHFDALHIILPNSTPTGSLVSLSHINTAAVTATHTTNNSGTSNEAGNHVNLETDQSSGSAHAMSSNNHSNDNSANNNVASPVSSAFPLPSPSSAISAEANNEETEESASSEAVMAATTTTTTTTTTTSAEQPESSPPQSMEHNQSSSASTNVHSNTTSLIVKGVCVMGKKSNTWGNQAASQTSLHHIDTEREDDHKQLSWVIS